MFTLRQRIFIIISIVAGLILAVILGILAFTKFSKNASPTATSTSSDTNVIPVAPAALIQNTPTLPATTNEEPVFSTEIPRDRYARQIAQLFVERFATRSTQNNNAHIDTVLPFVTDSMADWVKTQTNLPTDVYSGVTTRVISANVSRIDDASATVLVEVQQQQEDATGITNISKKGRVELVAVENNQWKVNGFFWEK